MLLVVACNITYYSLLITAALAAPRLPLAVLPRHAQPGHHVGLAGEVVILGDLALIQPDLEEEQLLADAVLVQQLPLGHLRDLVEDEAEAADGQRDGGEQQAEHLGRRPL